MRAPAHILLVNVHFAPFSYGGATVVAEAVAGHLRRDHGCRVTAVSSILQPDLPPYTVIRADTDLGPNYMINLPRRLGYVDSYANAEVDRIIAGLMTDLAPDLVHAHCLQGLGAGVLELAKARAIPVVLSMHDFWWICERQFMLRANGRYCAQDPVRLQDCKGCVADLTRAKQRSTWLAQAVTQADLVTFPSAFAQDLSQRSGITPRVSAVWSNGITPPGATFFDRQAARRAGDGRLVFGYLGGPSQVKGWPLIKAAFSSGLERGDFRGLLVEAGLNESWWAGQRLDRLAGDWSVHPRFEQAGMDAFYEKIDVLLFPSQWKETFGLSLREAAARGIRVIQTDAGGAAEWDGVEPEALMPIGAGAEALRERIRSVLASPEAHPPPRAMPGFNDQAAAFINLLQDLPDPPSPGKS